MRLPKEFRLPGDRVRVRHVGAGVLLEPIASARTGLVVRAVQRPGRIDVVHAGA